jgi:hypothetical protein
MLQSNDAGQLQPIDLARGKLGVSTTDLTALTGPYDHRTQRRWNGNDAALVAFSMKSSTLFDGESKTGEGPDDR